MDAIKPFSKIRAFVNDLNNIYGSKYKNIDLYYKLIKTTPITNKTALIKHNNIFLNFLENNKDAVVNTDVSLLKDDKIMFSERVYINIKDLLKGEDSDVIFKHLQVISALLIQDNTQLLEALTNSNEEKFLNKFMDKIEGSFKTNEDNPLGGVMSLLQSGILNDMGREISSGKLNTKRLLQSLQGKTKSVVEELKKETTGKENDNDVINNLTNIADNLVDEKGDVNMEGLMSNIMSSTQSLSNGNMGGLGDVMNNIMGNLMGGSDPLASMIGNMTGVETNSQAPDLSNIMSMMSNLMGGNSQADLSNMMNNLMGQNKVEITEENDEETL